jgi:LCP family protein required for cell wall assembly
MPRNARIFLFVSAIIAVSLYLKISLAGFGNFSNLKTSTLQPTPTIKPTLVPETRTPKATSTPVAVCRGPTSMFILLIGSDTRADNYSAGLADSMRIVRVDFINPGVMFLTFQRDLYVEIPGIASHSNITHGKLNQAYLYGNPGFGYYDGPGQGPGLLATTLQQNFGTHVDHYIAVNLQTFVRVVDTIGGIDINLPTVIDGRVNGSTDLNRYFPAGNQHLDGYRTLLLARIRPDGDNERNNIQNLILQALAAKFLSPAALPQTPRLVEAFYGSVQTDLGAEDISKLLCLAYLLNNQKIVAFNFPDNILKGARVKDPVLGYTFVWDVDFNLLRAYVKYFNNGTWPKASLSPP